MVASVPAVLAARAATLALCLGGGPAAGQPETPETVAIQVPKSSRGSPNTGPSLPGGPPIGSSREAVATGSAAVPEVPAHADPPALAEPAAPDPAGAAPDPAPAPDPLRAPEAAPGDLLAPSRESDPTPRPSPTASGELPSEEDEARAALAARFRPAKDRARFNLVVRGNFVYAGSRAGETAGGRLGGARADLGLTTNYFGAAASLAVLGGALHLGPGRDVSALVGGGPSFGLGRLALISRGLLDLRLGYDFWLAIGQRDLAGSSFHAVPHGPRVTLDMALLVDPARDRVFWHGFGLHFGYQATVHSVRGPFPALHMLLVGVTYWMG